MTVAAVCGFGRESGGDDLSFLVLCENGGDDDIFG